MDKIKTDLTNSINTVKTDLTNSINNLKSEINTLKECIRSITPNNILKFLAAHRQYYGENIKNILSNTFQFGLDSYKVVSYSTKLDTDRTRTIWSRIPAIRSIDTEYVLLTLQSGSDNVDINIQSYNPYNGIYGEPMTFYADMYATSMLLHKYSYIWSSAWDPYINITVFTK